MAHTAQAETIFQYAVETLTQAQRSKSSYIQRKATQTLAALIQYHDHWDSESGIAQLPSIIVEWSRTVEEILKLYKDNKALYREDKTLFDLSTVKILLQHEVQTHYQELEHPAIAHKLVYDLPMHY